MASNKLIRSNRDREKEEMLKPQQTATGFDKKESKKTQQEIASVTFDTNLKISNHTRNRLQAMTTLGYAETQKEAIDVVLEYFVNSMTESEKKAFLFQCATLEKRDVKFRTQVKTKKK